MGCVLDESGIDEGECSRKVVSGRRVAGDIRSLVNASEFAASVFYGLARVIVGACSYVR